jgi:hypothetical protein
MEEEKAMKRLIALIALCALTATSAGCASYVDDIEVETGPDWAVISWTTDDDCTGLVKYGETAELGLKEYEDGEDCYDFYNSGAGIIGAIFLAMLEAMLCPEEDDDEWDDDWEEEVYNHSVRIEGLKPGTTYYFRIKVVNIEGASRQSHKKLFTTEWY